MEEFFKRLAGYIAFGVEVVAALIIACGAAEAVINLLRPARFMPHGRMKLVWHRFGMWLILGLEFMLAADIVRTAISPTWEQTGQLAAIAIIRTFLNYFLEKDIEKYAEPRPVAVESLGDAPPRTGNMG
jgi:uncharacterized membrane protein